MSGEGSDDEGIGGAAPQPPPNMRNIFRAMVTWPDGPLRPLEVMECFVYQHERRDVGEIDRGCAPVGRRGMTS